MVADNGGLDHDDHDDNGDVDYDDKVAVEPKWTREGRNRRQSHQ